MGADPYVGEVMLFAGTFVPRDYLPCDGRSLQIQQYAALYSLLGLTYGGNGTTTFNLPDLRAKVPAGTGQAPGGRNVALGASWGAENVTLSVPQMPAHTHAGNLTGSATVQVSTKPGTTAVAAGNYLAKATASSDNSDVNAYIPPATAGSPLGNLNGVSGASTLTIQPAGGSQPVSVCQPTMGLNYCICVNGLYPERP